MSASIGSVIYQAGFDITKKDDAIWFLAQLNEVEEMVEVANQTLENEDK